MRANPGSDEIKLNQYVAKDHGISDRTYQRGVRELLKSSSSTAARATGGSSSTSVHVQYGDRLAFVKS